MVVTSVEVAGTTGEKTTARRARASTSQEALRAEIEKDASALLALGAVKGALGERGFTAKRLTALRDGARGLAGKLAERAAKRGAGGEATKEEHAAVEAQRAKWGSCYRILTAVAAQDDRVRQLLIDTHR